MAYITKEIKKGIKLHCIVVENLLYYKTEN